MISWCFPGIVQLARVAELGEQKHGLVLVGVVLAVLERHVEEAAFFRLQLLVEILVDGRLGDGKSQMIGRELVCLTSRTYCAGTDRTE